MSMMVNDHEYPLGFRYDSDGTVWLKAKSNAAITKKTGTAIGMGATGWSAFTKADVAATGDVAAFIGFPEATLSTNEWGWFQIGGDITDGIIKTCTATVGHVVEWKDATLITSGATKQLDSGFGIFTATSTAAATHDIKLFPKLCLPRT